LPVREIVSATHILTDLTLSPAMVIYDYLTDTAPAADKT
jgi:acetoacetate decarboxylase